MKKKVLFITESLGIGGAQKIIVFVANHAVQAGYDVTIMSMKSDDNMFNISSRINIIIPEKKIENSRLKRIFFFKKIIYQGNFDCIINFPISKTSFFVLLGNKKPLLTSERGAPKMYSFLGSIVMKYMFSKSKLVGFQTPMARDYYTKIDLTKTFVIPNPIFFNKAGNGAPLLRQNVISVGRLDPVKKFDCLIESFLKVHDKFPEEKLIIYGDGPERSSLEKMIFDNQAQDFIKLPGKINITPDFYKQAKIFVLSSQYEGIPNTLLEALSTGTPIIATDCEPGGARFLTKNGTVGGPVVPFNDVYALSEAIESSLDNYKTSIEKGKLGQYVFEEFDPERIGKTWLKQLNYLVEEC